MTLLCVSAISAERSHLTVFYNRDIIVSPGLDHPVHQIPLTGEGVELKDIIIEGGIITALNIF